MKIERKTPVEVYPGKRFREKATGKCITVKEVTEKGFRYEIDLGWQTPIHPRLGLGIATGGELYTTEHPWLLEMFYEEADHIPYCEKIDIRAVMTTSNNGEDVWAIE